MMNKDIKTFIEKNIHTIEQEEYELLYEEAYEWLSDWQCGELSNILLKALKIDLTDVALFVTAKHIDIELNNMVAEKLPFISLPSFIRLFMNHTCGISYYDLKEYLISNPVMHPRISQDLDEHGKLYFVLKK